jgi:hypothetical protein
MKPTSFLRICLRNLPVLASLAMKITPYSGNRKDFCPWIVMIKRLFLDWINVSCCSYSIGYSRELAVKVHPDAAIPGLARRDSALLGAKPTFDHGI